jgi:hypothetical protein
MYKNLDVIDKLELSVYSLWFGDCFHIDVIDNFALFLPLFVFPFSNKATNSLLSFFLISCLVLMPRFCQFECGISGSNGW